MIGPVHAPSRLGMHLLPAVASVTLLGCLLAVAGCGTGEERQDSLDRYLLIGSRGEKAESEIVSYAPKTGEVTQLTDNDVADLEPEVSPDGTRILFMRATRRNTFPPYELWVMDANGEQQQRLTSGHDDLNPAWAADGKSIFFSRKTAGSAKYDLVEMPIAGGVVTTVVESSGPDGCVLAATQSPDGNQLVFKSYDECARYTSGVDSKVGNKTDDLSCAPFDSTAADFSSDGRLAFDSMGLDGYGSMRVVNADCSGERVNIPADSERFPTIVAPHWSPDAIWIAFSSEDGIWIVHPDGTGLRKLPSTAEINEADWLPD